MKTLVVVGVALSALLLSARTEVRATALAPAVEAGSAVTLVAQGCGRGFHRGRFGRCVRNMSRAYPCFWRRGPLGRWHLICR
ncbi:MAG TPA: hypothetical protein VFX37_14450 [Pseudolabrys sp.]|nr:hypothetical protein [Pseudolabrys sp.]